MSNSNPFNIIRLHPRVPVRFVLTTGEELQLTGYEFREVTKETPALLTMVLQSPNCNTEQTAGPPPTPEPIPPGVHRDEGGIIRSIYIKEGPGW